MWADANRRRLAIGLVVAALLAFEGYALLVKRSGESAFQPPPSDISLSPEVAGDIRLEQGFVMNADGLDTIRLFPHRSTSEPQGVVELMLIGDTYQQPIARLSAPASAVAASGAFDWHIPRVDRSAGRPYILRISVPEASPGHGLRFEVGGPGYPFGELSFGSRSFWGDLRFSTHATRARIIDSLADLRRHLPGVLRSDAALVIVLLAFNWALVTLVTRLAAPAARAAPPSSDQPTRSYKPS